MTATRNASADAPISDFSDSRAWAEWLEKHHATSTGVWLRITKTTAKTKSVSYADALEIAICYGWIDAQKRGESESTWLQRFTPRGKKSIWSKINRTKALALIDCGKMAPAGLREVERAKADGRWERAYDSPATAAVPEDFAAALKKNSKARAFFETLNSANRYAILFRLQNAKRRETRAKRLQQFIDMLEKKETFH